MRAPIPGAFRRPRHNRKLRRRNDEQPLLSRILSWPHLPQQCSDSFSYGIRDACRHGAGDGSRDSRCRLKDIRARYVRCYLPPWRSSQRGAWTISTFIRSRRTCALCEDGERFPGEGNPKVRTFSPAWVRSPQLGLPDGRARKKRRHIVLFRARKARTDVARGPISC